MPMATSTGKYVSKQYLLIEEDAGVHGCFKKIYYNLKSMLSFALSKLKPINQLVTIIVLQSYKKQSCFNQNPQFQISLPSDERESTGTK
jgi:hypothetical protein